MSEDGSASGDEAYQVVDLEAQHVAGISRSLTMATLKEEADVLPTGQYLTTTHVGPYDGLYQATVGLLRYAGEHGLQFDKQGSDEGEIWASRIEWYETNPAEQPDPSHWVTRLAFKLTDEQG